MKRKLFCEISPTTYQISLFKERTIRHIKDFFSAKKFSSKKEDKPLPVVIYTHKSLIRRKLGNVNRKLQENKAVNLSIAAPKVNGILIYPGETFSFWKLVGSISEKKGYKEGLTIANGKSIPGVGGGMCQFTNLIHWMVLHTPLEIVEHHHHDEMDLFPDYGRQIPFGTGTSIVYNFLDYEFYNPTDAIYQLLVSTNDTYLCGELRASKAQEYAYHISS
ncbi:MAG: VanW family protein, partial [Erysipelotrichaceae bacterium]|nr:VanW family protein [Erysipelotrichaceae bacterium]